jgi:hypothetical protein
MRKESNRLQPVEETLAAIRTSFPKVLDNEVRVIILYK